MGKIAACFTAMQYHKKAADPRPSRHEGIFKQNSFYSHSLSPVFERALVCKSNNIELVVNNWQPLF